MPPKASKAQRKAASTANSEDLCGICCQKLGPKDEVLFCSGSCQKQLHRYCASVGESHYRALTSSGAPPFLCYCCFRAQKDEQVSMLLSVIESLKEEVTMLKSSRLETQLTPASTSTSTSQAAASKMTTEAAYSSREFDTHSTSHASHSSESKFNVVLFGVQECPSGMSKSARFESDLSNTVGVLSSIDSSIQPQSIRDCFRLGKFSPRASRPRPILIKFVRAPDVVSILSKKRNLSHPYSIKPDMPRDQRQQESVLLRERWNLIQSGVDRKNIRIKGNSLYVNGKLHGRVSNLKFVRQDNAPSHPDHPNSPRSNSPIVQHDQQSSRNVHTLSALDKSTSSSVDSSVSQHVLSVSVNSNPPSPYSNSLPHKS